MAAADDDTWVEVGARVRAAREAKGISVRELSRRVGVSASHISQVERGIGSFSVPAFHSIARELETSVQRLLTAPSASVPDPLRGPFPPDGDLEDLGVVLRNASRPWISMGNGPKWGLLTPVSEPDVEFVEVVYPATTHEPGRAIQHAGREYGLVVEGQLVLEVDGIRTVLGSGDSFLFDSTRPHRYFNESGSPARVISYVRDRTPWITVPHA